MSTPRPSPFAGIRIAGTCAVPAGPAVSTAELVTRVTPPRDAADVEARTGIRSRRFAAPDASSADLGALALQGALSAADLPASALARIILVASGSEDLVFPATANLVAARLGLRGTCDCFDLSNACMGFLSALDVAARSIATGSGPVGIAVTELASHVIGPEDPRPYLVFGDGVAAAVVTGDGRGGGILGSWLRNDGVAFGNVRLANPIMTGQREMIRFTASHAQMGAEAIDAVRRATDEVLRQAGLTLSDVHWVLPHQPNGSLLAAIMQALDLQAERVVPVVHETGSVGAASIPISLDRLLRTRPVAPGDRILMVGVGAGLASGAILYQVGE